jgi:hypothetical protein
MARDRELTKDKNQTLIQGRCPDPSSVGEFTIGTSSAIDVTGRLAIFWNSKSGTNICRKLNSNSVGITGTSGSHVLSGDITSITFTGTAGNVVEWELS